ncbi:MAG: arsenate reductase [Thalassomonas sp.]|jgi:arsenate reductase
MSKVLILCTGNSCRSQMAEGLIANFFSKIQVYSAGTNPEKVNPFAVKAMAEMGIDISANVSNHADEYAHIDFDYVFTVCDNAKEICPIYPKAKQLIHHSFSDPADATGTEKEQLKVYVAVRNELSAYFTSFFKGKS